MSFYIFNCIQTSNYRATSNQLIISWNPFYHEFLYIQPILLLLKGTPFNILLSQHAAIPIKWQNHLAPVNIQEIDPLLS